MSPKIAVVGDYMIDIDDFYTSIRSSPENPNIPIVSASKFQSSRAGGTGAVVKMIEGMCGFGIALPIAERIKPRCIKTRIYVDKKQLFRIDDDMTFDISLSAIEIIIKEIPIDCEIIIVSDYGKGVVTNDLWQQLLTLGKKIIVDPSRLRQPQWYQGAWGIVPNRVEAGGYLQTIQDAINRCKQLQNHFPNVCLKIGSDGMIANGQHIPAEKIDCIDVCGAGDMVTAAIAVGISRDLSWIDACRYANHMAALKCQQRGATPVEKRFEDYRRSHLHKSSNGMPDSLSEIPQSQSPPSGEPKP